MPYTLIDHTADMGMKLSAPTLAELFQDAALALVDIMGAHASRGIDRLALEVKGIDRVDLLVRWLQEILYLVQVKGLRIKAVSIKGLLKTKIEAVLEGAYSGEPIEHEIKAVTYHNLQIRKVDNAWSATIILDT
jgi:SHS2 domain-containing protein